jgi:hypothetical protein
MNIQAQIISLADWLRDSGHSSFKKERGAYGGDYLKLWISPSKEASHAVFLAGSVNLETGNASANTHTSTNVGSAIPLLHTLTTHIHGNKYHKSAIEPAINLCIHRAYADWLKGAA